MCFLEKSISALLLYFVFDPNDDILRGQITGVCEDFLKPLLYSRALKEFQVVCDGRNNTPEMAEAGELYVDVYVKPILPAKVIVLTAVITKQGASFNELIATNAARG